MKMSRALYNGELVTILSVDGPKKSAKATIRNVHGFVTENVPVRNLERLAKDDERATFTVGNDDT